MQLLKQIHIFLFQNPYSWVPESGLSFVSSLSFTQFSMFFTVSLLAFQLFIPLVLPPLALTLVSWPKSSQPGNRFLWYPAEIKYWSRRLVYPWRQSSEIRLRIPSVPWSSALSQQSKFTLAFTVCYGSISRLMISPFKVFAVIFISQWQILLVL